MNKNKVAIAILNYNGEKLLSKYLPKVVEFSPTVDIYVIDNASNDSSLALLRTSFSAVKIISFDKNFGFAEGYNRGLRQIEADVIVLLNSDVRVTENWLLSIEDLFDDENIAAVQPKILNDLNPSYFEYAGAAGGFVDTLGYPFCMGRIFEHCENDFGQYDEDRSIFWASGACMAIKKSVFQMLGGFDEFLFAHMEEIDLAYRINQSGLKIVNSSQSKVYHLGGGTLQKMSSFKHYLNFRNSLIVLFKNDASAYWPFKIVFRLLLDGLAGFRFFIKGQFKFTFAIIKAHFAFYGYLIKNFRRRAETKALVKKNIHKELLGLKPWNGLVVWAYYFKKMTRFSDYKI